MNCPYCDDNFNDIDKYIFHLKYIHKKDIFICHIDNCLRSFHRKDSFKKHILTHGFDTSLKKLVDVPISYTIQVHTSDSNSNTEFCSEIESSSNDEKDTLKDIPSFLKKLDIATQHLVAQLYDNLSLAKSDIQKIIEIIQNFCCSELLNRLEQIILNCDLNEVVDSFKVISKYFNNFNTEYKRESFFKNLKCFIKPSQIIIGASPDESRRQNRVSLTIKNRTCCYVPIQEQLQQFFKLPDVLQQILDYQKYLEINNIESYKNMVQDSLWKSIKTVTTSNKIILPLILYFDDFEVGNPLGNHAGYYKIGCLYYSIPTIPPKYSSRLENIFISTLFHSSDRCHFGNSAVLKHIINELKFLGKDGLYIENDKKHIYFACSFVIGDNLGVHSILGLTESFSSNYYCMFCLADKNVTKELITEQSNLLRLKDQYVYHLENKYFGIKERCIFNDLEYYHIYENQCVDVMHDLYKGVLRYDMANIISKLIYLKYFTLESLNFKIKYNLYNPHEKNIPPAIKEDHLKNESIICSAAEMNALVNNFRFIVGDIVPQGNEIWKLYLLALKITEIGSSSCIPKTAIQRLSLYISEHNKLYISLFGNLKPKYHFLTHYPRIIEKIGPPHYLSSMRFEAKHKDLKLNAHNCRSRVNLPFTLFNRIQLRCTYRYLNKKGFPDNIQWGHINIAKFRNKTNTETFKDFVLATYYEKNGICYKPSFVIRIADNILPQFSRIKYVLKKISDNNCYLYCERLITLDYNEHFYAYEITNDKKKNFTFYSINELSYLLPLNLHVINTGQMMLSLSKY